MWLLIVFGCFMHTLLQFLDSLHPFVLVQAKRFAMHNFNLHSEFYNQPILLTDEEKQDPLPAIRAFFEDVKLVEVRTHLYNLLQVALITPNTIYDEANERDAILCFIKEIETVMVATNILTTNAFGIKFK